MDIKRKWIYPAAAAVCVVAVIIGNMITTSNDGKLAPNDLVHIITRTPIDNTGFFYGEEPRAGIMLSWHDNTIKLEEDGAKGSINGRLYPVTLPDTSLIFESSDKKIAEVDNKGIIKAKHPGSVEITVKNEYTGAQSKAYLQVVQPVTSFMLDKSTIDLYLTDSGVRLSAKVEPENASNTTVQWYSKDSNIVKVDNNGGLIPVRTGMTEVLATTTDGGFTGRCFVNVINKVIKAEKVTIQNKDNVTMKVGETWYGLASVLPANAKNKTVEWSTSDEKIATVTKNGRVRAVGEGTVTITAKNSDGPSDSVKITVRGRVNIQTADGNQSYQSGGGVTYTAYDMTLDEITDKEMASSTTPTYNGSTASREDVKRYLDPNLYCSGAYKYQFMDLSRTNGISADTLNRYLEGKGAMSGQGAAFIEAAREYNVSELYLVAHAMLETGYGSSRLASGAEVNGTRVYNFFGIGAYDSSAVSSGLAKAYSEGWTTPALAIKGGAKWISDHYVNASGCRQNTLYKMRWNPENPGQHTYASAIDWSTSISIILERLHTQMPGGTIGYEVPVYQGSNAAVIEQ